MDNCESRNKNGRLFFKDSSKVLKYIRGKRSSYRSAESTSMKNTAAVLSFVLTDVISFNQQTLNAFVLIV